MKSGKPIAVFILTCLFSAVLYTQKSATAPVSQKEDMPSSTDQWNLGQTGINAQAAWEHFGVDGNGVKIAIIDSGVNYNLPDLNGTKYLGGYDFCPTGTGTSCSGDDDNPMDIYDHGTEAASVMLGRGDTIAGVAPEAQYYALKITNDDSRSSTAISLKALDWIAANGGADIVYMGFHSWSSVSNWKFIENSYDANGTLFVASSYNIASEPYPAAYEKVIGAGAHSRYEPQTIMPGTGGYADVLGPGEEVPALSLDGSIANATDPVGVAAAQVAGSLALMIDYNRQHSLGYSNSAMWTTLLYGAVDLWPGEPDAGWGKADVYNALTLMANGWFIDVNSQFTEPNYYDGGLPGYFSSGKLNYAVTIINNIPLDFTGHRDIGELNVIVTLRYDGHDCNQPLAGNSTKVFNINLPADSNRLLLGSYDIPYDINQGKIALDVKIAVDGVLPFYVNNAVIRQIAGSSYGIIRIPCGQQVDFIADKIIDFRDFSAMAFWWLEDCNQENSWCDGTDLNSNGLVDSNDLGSFIASWLCRYP